MRNGDAKWRRATPGGHGRNEHRPKMIVHFSRRHDDARARLGDFAADGGVKIDKPNVATVHTLG